MAKINPSRERGRRAGASAPPTPKKRTEYPAAVDARLRLAIPATKGVAKKK